MVDTVGLPVYNGDIDAYVVEADECAVMKKPEFQTRPIDFFPPTHSDLKRLEEKIELLQAEMAQLKRA